jgi:hypothetical protein
MVGKDRLVRGFCVAVGAVVCLGIEAGAASLKISYDGYVVQWTEGWLELKPTEPGYLTHKETRVKEYYFSDQSVFDYTGEYKNSMNNLYARNILNIEIKYEIDKNKLHLIGRHDSCAWTIDGRGDEFIFHIIYTHPEKNAFYQESSLWASLRPSFNPYTEITDKISFEGDVPLAVEIPKTPLPPGAALLLTGLPALALVARRKKRRT